MIRMEVALLAARELRDLREPKGPDFGLAGQDWSTFFGVTLGDPLSVTTGRGNEGLGGWKPRILSKHPSELWPLVALYVHSPTCKHRPDTDYASPDPSRIDFVLDVFDTNVVMSYISSTVDRVKGVEMHEALRQLKQHFSIYDPDEGYFL